VKIGYCVDKPGNVTLSLQSILGERIVHLQKDVFKEAGRYSIEFNTADLPSGMYFCTLKAGNQIYVVKFLVIK
jgi:hypothetical protein